MSDSKKQAKGKKNQDEGKAPPADDASKDEGKAGKKEAKGKGKKK